MVCAIAHAFSPVPAAAPPVAIDAAIAAGVHAANAAAPPAFAAKAFAASDALPIVWVIIKFFSISTPTCTMELTTLFRIVLPSERIASAADIVPVINPVITFEALPANESTAEAIIS